MMGGANFAIGQGEGGCLPIPDGDGWVRSRRVSSGEMGL